MVLLRFIKKHLIGSIFISIALGIVIGSIVDMSWAKGLVLPLTFMLVYPMMVTLQLNKLFEQSNIKLQLITQLINFIVYPAIAYGLGLLFFQEEPYFRLGLLLIALLPTSGMTISWTVMAKGTVSEAIRMVVIGLLLGALLTPLYITVLLDEAISVPFMTIFQQILLVVFVPLLLAYVTQRLLIRQYGETTFHKSIKPVFPLFSTLGVVLIIFVAIALKATVIIANPGMLLEIIVPLLLLYAAFIGVALLTATFFPKPDGIALSNGTLIRSLSLALAITLSAFDGAGITALMIAIAYVIQVQVAAWNVRLADKLYRSRNVKKQIMEPRND